MSNTKCCLLLGVVSYWLFWFISTIVVLLPLIFFSKQEKSLKELVAAGSLILAGGSFAVGERLANRSLDGVKGRIPANS